VEVETTGMSKGKCDGDEIHETQVVRKCLRRVAMGGSGDHNSDRHLTERR
jgi:hypothetical protein